MSTRSNYLHSASGPQRAIFGPRSANWSILGPGGGGCVHILTVNPQCPDTLLVSCDMTAGYISHDRGESWRSFNLKSRIYAFAFDPANPDVIYAGSSGLFRSEDNGLTWRLLFPDPQTVVGETRLGDEANHTYLSTNNWSGGTVCAIWAVGPKVLICVKADALLVYESGDGGATWEPRGALAGEELHLLLPDPSDASGCPLAFTDAGIARLHGSEWKASVLPEEFRRIRSAAWGVDPASGAVSYFLTATESLSCGRMTTSVFRAGPRALVWTRCSDGLESRDDEGERVPVVFSQVSACRVDACTVYLIAEQLRERNQAGEWVARHGILKSADGGASWQWIVKMDDVTDPQNREFGWAERDYGAGWGDLTGDDQISPKWRFAWDVVASPVDPQTCYTMDFSTIYETRDGGAQWRQLVTRLLEDGSAVSRGIDVLSAYTVAFDPFDASHVALPMTDAGVFHSYDRGRTWVHSLQGVPREWINTCYWLVFDPDIPGKAWSAWAAMHDLPRSKMFRDDLFAWDEGGVCVTEDGLRSWRVSSDRLPHRILPTHILIDPTSPPERRTIYLAAMMGGISRSADDGRTWQPMNQGLCDRPAAWRLARLPDGELYLVTVYDHTPGKERRGGLWRWQRERARRDPVTLPPNILAPNYLTFDPGGRLYLACWPAPPGEQERGGGVIASDNRGETWQRLFDEEAHAYTVTVDRRNPARLYLATFDAALFRSNDRGASWEPMQGYDFQWCRRAVLDPLSPGMVYITTFGNSVWYGRG